MKENITGKLLKAWFELLNGFIPGVPVYRTDARSTVTQYIIVRPESGSDQSNNQKHVDQVVIITEVVTKFDVAIDDQIAIDIDKQIAQLLYPSGPAAHALPQQDDIQVTRVIRQNQTYLPEDDGTQRIFTIATRNVHRVVQLQEAS